MTKNFKLKEFKCKGNIKGCDCQMPLEVYENIIKLSSQLQFLRDYTGRPITVNSGYRCPEYNAKISGSSKKSQHIFLVKKEYFGTEIFMFCVLYLQQLLILRLFGI